MKDAITTGFNFIKKELRAVGCPFRAGYPTDKFFGAYLFYNFIGFALVLFTIYCGSYMIGAVFGQWWLGFIGFAAAHFLCLYRRLHVTWLLPAAERDGAFIYYVWSFFFGPILNFYVVVIGAVVTVVLVIPLTLFGLMCNVISDKTFKTQDYSDFKRVQETKEWKRGTV